MKIRAGMGFILDDISPFDILSEVKFFFFFFQALVFNHIKQNYYLVTIK